MIREFLQPSGRTVAGMPSMRAPGGWRVEPITVERGGRTLQLYRVSRHGVFAAECRAVEELAGVGVSVDQLVEDGT